MFNPLPNPVYAKSSEASFVNNDDRVLAVTIGGELRYIGHTTMPNFSALPLAGAQVHALRIENNTVLVTSVEVPEPVAVRYAWRDAPVAGLFNKEGLPANPFRTDDWPGKTADAK